MILSFDKSAIFTGLFFTIASHLGIVALMIKN
jgi:hypothetical protein